MSGEEPTPEPVDELAIKRAARLKAERARIDEAIIARAAHIKTTQEQNDEQTKT
jgi:hypothetical protein